jgi:hypothetical protein
MGIYDILNILVSIFGILTSLIVILAALRFFIKNKKGEKTRLDPFTTFDNEIKRINKTLENDRDLSINAGDKQFLLLKEYHAQGLAQSKVSFWFSVVFASIGFVIILMAILSALSNSKGDSSGAVITLISGVVIEAVSALFFVQSNKSRDLMSSFFDKLRSDRKLEEAITLANQIPDENLQSKVKMILSLNFAQVSTTDDILTVVLKEID